MAKTVVNLSDQISTWVTKTNAISDDVGDVAQLVTGDSNVVDAINTVRTLVTGFDESAEIIAIARGGFSVDNTNGGGIFLSYDSSTGVIDITSQLVSSTTINYDSSNRLFELLDSAVTTAKLDDAAVTTIKLAADAVDQNKLKDVVSLTIYDASGTAVKTIYGAGS